MLSFPALGFQRNVYIEAEVNGIFWHDNIFRWFSMDVMGLAETRRESEGDFPQKGMIDERQLYRPEREHLISQMYCAMFCSIWVVVSNIFNFHPYLGK